MYPGTLFADVCHIEAVGIQPDLGDGRAEGRQGGERGAVLRFGAVEVQLVGAAIVVKRADEIEAVLLRRGISFGNGEARLGAAKGERLVVAIWIGTGIGGAVLLDGNLWLGRNRNAGEIGQSFVDLRRAGNGTTEGTLEGIGAKVGMTAFMRRRIERGERTSVARQVLEKDGRLKGSDLRKALAAGDALVERALTRSARAVGVTIAPLWNVFSPDLFVLGGGVAEDAGDAYVGQVRDFASRHAFFTDLADVRIVRSALGDDAGILGAAVLARETPGDRG